MYWRGDVPLTVAPFNAVDNLVLSQLAYTSFDGVKRDRLGAMLSAMENTENGEAGGSQ